MGCWGITAYESDDGMDALGAIRGALPADGKLTLQTLMDTLQNDEWNYPRKVEEGASHTSYMMLAEVIVKFLDHSICEMDRDEEWAAEDNKFASVSSFTASKESLRTLRDYLTDTLRCARNNAVERTKSGVPWNGWFKEKNWLGWQQHMESLAERLNGLLSLPGAEVDLMTGESLALSVYTEQTQTEAPLMGQSM